MHILLKLPAELHRHIIRRVEPDHADLAVIRQKLPHLRLDLVFKIPLEMLFLRLEIPCVSVAVRVFPVLHLRIIQAELDVVPPAGLRKLLHHVPSERGVHDVVVGNLRVIHGKAVMMLRREAQIFRAERLRRRGPCLCVKVHRVKRLCQLPVLRKRNLRIAHDPFRSVRIMYAVPDSAQLRIQAPVDKQAVPRRVEPFQPFRALHPFTEPAITPLWICLWNNTYIMIDGIAESTMNAKIGPSFRSPSP